MSAPPAVRVGGLALVGAALLTWPAREFRVDVIGGACATLPPQNARLIAGAIYLLAVVLLALAWREALKAELRLSWLFALAAAVHALALVEPPFLSADPLYYAAWGKALAHGATNTLRLDQLLPNDPWLALLPEAWRDGGLPYFVGFDAVARAIALLAGERLIVALRAYQLLGCACTFGAAALLVRAFDEPREQRRAAALVLFAPITVIEATQGGHNDALLMLATAAFACALMRRRPSLALLALGGALFVKASALILFVTELLRRAWARIARTSAPPAWLVAIAGAALFAAGLIAVLALQARSATVRAYTALIGSPRDTWEHCTRSVECLPRALFRYLAGWPRAAWVTGLVFRGLGVVWLWLASLRASREASPPSVLGALATALFVYYLLFHGYMESWYLLSLVPLAAFASPALAPAIRFFTVCAVAYYPLDLVLECSRVPALVGVKEFAGAVVTVAVPGVYALRRARLA